MKRIALAAAIAALTVFAEEPVSPQTDKQEVTQFNKASSIMGMVVKDSAGKDLGKVQELVFDLESQKMGYAVISLNSQGGNRLIPVPITALKPGKDHFVLNMSQSVLAAATGVANDEWPAPDAFAVGGPAEAEKGKGSSSESTR
jgi:sporulation protein YlmC with PRC-barrel domain